MSSRKGGAFERETCVKLSEWWSSGERSDLFWRTGGSGGRAKVRGRKGKLTKGQHGDICATDPEGIALIQLLTIELKRGYSKTTVADMLDRRKGSATQGWEKWLEQVLESYSQAGSVSWLLVQRRDQRQSIVFFPVDLFDSLSQAGSFSGYPIPSAVFYIKTKDKEVHSIVCMTLDRFLHSVSPEDVRKLVGEL